MEALIGLAACVVAGENPRGKEGAERRGLERMGPPEGHEWIQWMRW